MDEYEKPEYIVKPDIHVFFLAFFFAVVACAVWKTIEGNKVYTAAYTIIFIITSAFYLFQLFAFRVWVYKDYCYVRGLGKKKKYYYEELILCDKGKDGFFGTNEAVIVDQNGSKLIYLSNYYKNYDEFYNLMEKNYYIKFI